MKTIRRLPLTTLGGVALMALGLAAPAQAEILQGGIPLNSNNAVHGLNIAAGVGNLAQQQIGATQGFGTASPSAVATNVESSSPAVTNGLTTARTAAPGSVPAGFGMSGGVPLVSTNTAVATNVAAGINNQATQSLDAAQSGPMVDLDFSGRRPMVTTNVGVATNVGAGLGNGAFQGAGFGNGAFQGAGFGQR